MLGEPTLGSILAAKDLQMVDVADLFRRVDLDPDGHAQSPVTRLSCPHALIG
jgi:hypothetical protein